jgi:hypothetical protein
MGSFDFLKTSSGFGKGVMSSGVSVAKGIELLVSAEPLARIEYSVGDSGVWQHAGDFPKGDVTLDLPLSSAQPFEAGSEIPIRFRAFNGVSWTPAADEPMVTAVMNARPTIALLDNSATPLSVTPGVDVALPVALGDRDQDRLHALCVFDGGAKAAAASQSGDRVVLPASAFEGQLAPGSHSMVVYAFDGYEMSEKSVTLAYVASESPAADDDDGVPEMTPVAIAGIAIGVIAVVAVVAVIVVSIRRARKESSSTALVESE